MLLNETFVNATFEHQPLLGVALIRAVDVLPLPSPAVYFDTSLAFRPVARLGYSEYTTTDNVWRMRRPDDPRYQ